MADETYILDALVTGTATITVSEDQTGFDQIVVQGIYAEPVTINLAWFTEGGLPTQAEGNYFTSDPISGQNIGHRLIILGVIEQAVGSNGRDFIQGSQLDNTLFGDNLISGPGGNDTVWGGAGDDILYGGSGSDEMGGGEDNDILSGGDGADVINGDSGIDTVTGGAGADSMSGGASVGDTVSFQGSALGVTVGLTFGSATTGLGGDAEGDTIRGFYNIQGSDAADTLADNDKGVIAFGQNDNAFWGMGGNDALALGGGNDTGFGGTGRDLVQGEDGNDSLYGGEDRDTLVGGEGDDLLDGGISADTLIGGNGDDTYIARTNTAAISEGQTGGHDLIIASVNWTLQTWVEDLTLADTATQGAGNSRANIITGNILDNVLTAWGGDDRVFGMGGRDSLDGGEGNDRLDGGADGDTMKGGNGDDTYYANLATDVVIEALGQGRDLMVASVNWALQAGLDDLTLAGTALRGAGNNFANRLTGNGLDNVLTGFNGNDTLSGGAGNDSLLGGGADDVMSGGRGADSLSGGLGADQFVFASLAEFASQAEGYDKIADFHQVELDKINLSALDAKAGIAGNQAFRFIADADFSGVRGQLHYVTSGADLLVSGDTNGDRTADFTLLVQGVTSLAAGDFTL